MVDDAIELPFEIGHKRLGGKENGLSNAADEQTVVSPTVGDLV